MEKKSIIVWESGTPTKYGCYLVLCEHNGRRVVHHDVWFDDSRGWQSKWHNMIAWCALEDIEFQTDYWERLEHTYAGMAMQGLLTNTALAKLLHDDNASIKDKTGIFSEWAKMYAHALVEKMKEVRK